MISGFTKTLWSVGKNTVTLADLGLSPRSTVSSVIPFTFLEFCFLMY